MKILKFAILFILSFQALSIESVLEYRPLGKIIGEVVEDEQTHLGISIMSDQRPNTVEVNIYLNGKKDYRYRHIFFYLDIESYNNLFNSELSVSGQYEMDSDFLIKYRGNGTYDNRTIIFETQFFDDDEMIASKEISTIVLHDLKADISIEAYRRRVFLGFVGSLRSVAKTKAFDMDVDRSGIFFYGGNKNQIIGKTAIYENIIAAGKDNSYKSLKRLCEKNFE
ncbi:MAG: hypothetical protein H6622_07345 [Halobacteriovoraceae bacterium]|nr:hypothetical protein [Halobacteriovoraceae bacterium]